ncbi:alpha/beta fold hydrolase [Paenibacillus monticola]|nr:alpha/beta hydrolase [Paenibacillus monticola]
MIIMKKKLTATVLTGIVLLAGMQLGSGATANAADSSLPVIQTLSTQYDISPNRVFYNASTRYIQIDGEDVLKPNTIKNGRAYAPSESIAAAVAKAQTQQPLTFVLIHGAWADASFWDKTAAELRKAGHTVYAPEYAGHGTLYDPNVTHEQIVTSVVDYIKSKKLTNIVLVGHSFGGTIIQKVAEQIPERIHRLVFFDAFVPLDGQSVVDQAPGLEAGFGHLREASGNNTLPLPFSMFRDSFVNTASLSLAKEIYQNAKPEPAGPLFEKLDLKTFYTLELPKSYLYLTSDTALPQGSYGWNPTQASHLGQFRLITGEGDHMTTAFAAPKYLEEKLYEASRD